MTSGEINKAEETRSQISSRYFPAADKADTHSNIVINSKADSNFKVQLLNEQIHGLS